MGGLPLTGTSPAGATGEQAAYLGMNGSPSVPVHGVDPFAMPGARPSVSCRPYRGSGGMVDGAPSVAGLRSMRRWTRRAGRAAWPGNRDQAVLGPIMLG